MRSLVALATLAVMVVGSVAPPPASDLLQAESALELSVDPSPVPSDPRALQADESHPVWAALRATGLGRAEFAQLMLADADGNRATDFLDLVLALAPADSTPVELLVYGDAAARLELAAEFAGSADLAPAVEAVFLTAPLSSVRSIAERPGVSLAVFEPRAYTTSTNPAGGSPSTMPQITLHGGHVAWSTTPTAFTGLGIRIAIIDTGADPLHQALDAGKVSNWKDCTSSAGTAYDDNGHGTHVASTAAGDDGTDFRGIAYQASVVAVKVLNAAGSGTLAQFQCAVNWVKNTAGTPRADVASMSAGLGVPPLGITTLNGGTLDLFGWDAVAEQLPNADIPFTVAAGNWIGPLIEILDVDETTQVGVNGVNQVSSPGIAPRVIAVGAVTEFGNAAHFTALGPGRIPTQQKPDVAAMGFDTWGALTGTTNVYGELSGTSMATPLAAGVIAILMDKDNTKFHTVYENALRTGAARECIIANSPTPGDCFFGTIHPLDPNFVVGHGVVKAQASLPLV